MGKSTIVRQFAKQEYKSHILIDFSKCSQEVFNLFNDISDLNHLFVRLQLAYGVGLHERNSVILPEALTNATSGLCHPPVPI